ncbi:MAG: ParB/RepB/Spo0J family partition protein [Deltaproteobacteria bacterium]|nr:ParB/RepB/Spo0J family partition protein [Deltaproteobacteria bacterium]
MTTREKAPSTRRGALGKGISSLLGDLSDDHSEEANVGTKISDEKLKRKLDAEVVRLNVEEIDPNPQQPRKLFDDRALKELSDSLKIDGVLQPIVVTQAPQAGRYYVVAGERRLRASKLAGLTTIPAIVREGANTDLLRLALIENIQRADLNILEEAEAYSALIKDYGLTQEQCADRVGKERSTVTNALRLLTLPREIQEDIVSTRLSMGHGRAILSLDDKKTMLRCRDIVVKKSLSVRQTEQLCKSIKSPVKTSDQKSAAIKDEADLQYITESLRNYLHTKIRVAGSTSRGKIEISYFSAAELERLLKLMGHRF